MTDFVDRLRTIVGDKGLITDERDKHPFLTDWRENYLGKALAIVRPATTEEVAAVVKLCAAEKVAICPQGGNTGMSGGATPQEDSREIVLSLTRMNRILEIDKVGYTMTVEAGVVLKTIQDAAADADRLFPLSLGAEGSCTIGGNLATNAGGTQVLRYGNARDLCLGLEVVTPQGEIWEGTSGLRKDNTGYDLRDLIVGSEGTLGIITAATMKLYPLPAAQLTAWAAVPSLDHAVTLLGLAHKRLGAGLTGFEVMGKFALSLVAKHFPALRVPFIDDEAVPYCVLLENSDNESEDHARARFEALLETAFEAGCVTDAVVAENLTQAHQLWHVRESIPLAQAEEGLNIKHDISIAVSRIPAFVAETDALLQREIPGVRLVNFGHLGDGNLHYNVQAPAGGDNGAFLREHEDRINTLVYDEVEKFEGSFSAEHGVGSLKVEKLEKHKSPVALAMMRAIKRGLDPQNILNPGRVIRNT